MPLTTNDDQFWGDGFQEYRNQLEEEGLLKNRGERRYPIPSIPYPAERISIRSTSSLYYIILDTTQNNRRLETLESSMVMSQIHPGAIYLHQGESYLVTDLDIASRTAYVEPVDAPYYTQAMELTDLKVLKVTAEKGPPGARVFLGEVEVTSSVIAFKKRMQLTEEVIGMEPLDLPDNCFDTQALWFDIPQKAIEQIDKASLDFAGGLHAAEHASIALLPLFAMCDRNDLGGLSTPFHPDTGKAQIFIYDAHPGGIGISEKGFELIQDLWQETLKMIRECPCTEGCPSCIQSPKCGNNNHPLDKKVAKILLEELAGMSVKK